MEFEMTYIVQYAVMLNREFTVRSVWGWVIWAGEEYGVYGGG